MATCKCGENTEFFRVVKDHTPECLFHHFCSYSGISPDDENVEILLKAFLDGYDAGKQTALSMVEQFSKLIQAGES